MRSSCATKDDIELVRRHGDITGRLLRLFGFNLDLCPVLDISFDDDADNSLRGRCYGEDGRAKSLGWPARSTTRCAGRGSRAAANIFPVTPPRRLDAHHELPRIDRTRETNWTRKELAVFGSSHQQTSTA